MIYQAQVRLGGLPVNLMLVGNREYGKVVFVKVAKFGTVFDTTEDGKFIRAAFYEDVFHIFDDGDNGELQEVFEYNVMYDYKEIPLMLKWLQSQNLQQPQ